MPFARSKAPLSEPFGCLMENPTGFFRFFTLMDNTLVHHVTRMLCSMLIHEETQSNTSQLTFITLLPSQLGCRHGLRYKVLYINIELRGPVLDIGLSLRRTVVCQRLVHSHMNEGMRTKR